MTKQFFKIQTLRDGGTPMDPVTIITGGVALVSSIFPNLFGGGRKALTSSDWNNLLPGSGYWTSLLRSYLSKSIKYDSDIKNMEKFTGYFVWDNRQTICPETPSSCFPYDNPHLCPECMNKFFNLLKKESVTGGNSPVGQFPGGVGTLDLTTLLLFGAGIVAVIAVAKKKKRSNKK